GGRVRRHTERPRARPRRRRTALAQTDDARRVEDARQDSGRAAREAARPVAAGFIYFLNVRREYVEKASVSARPVGGLSRRPRARNSAFRLRRMALRQRLLHLARCPGHY